MIVCILNYTASDSKGVFGTGVLIACSIFSGDINGLIWDTCSGVLLFPGISRRKTTSLDITCGEHVQLSPESLTG